MMTDAGSFFNLVRSPLKFRLFLMQKLPAAFWSGVKLVEANAEQCTASVPYKWATQNPFRSTYFACLAMAAEMSTGVLAMAHVWGRKPGVSMLVGNMESSFHKKATGITYFTCTEGDAIKAAVENAVQTGESQSIKVYTRGTNKAGELVAEFWITWLFKQKGK